MKRNLKNLFIAFLFSAMIGNSLPIFAFGPSNPFIITVSKEGNEDSDDELKGGNRKPARPIYCTISESGVNVDLYGEEIISYEIWDEEGLFCFGAYAFEADFINHLFSYPGSYLIKFVTAESVYVGYLYAD